MMSKFAEKTKVSSQQSRMEIETILTKYGAAGFMYGWNGSDAVIGFAMNSMHIKFLLPMPNKTSQEITHKDKWHERTKIQQEALYEQLVRQRWRCLVLAIKAKLECVESGITTFENEFLAHIVLPNGQTFGNYIKPQLIEAYSNGKMPSLLATGGEGG